MARPITAAAPLFVALVATVLAGCAITQPVLGEDPSATPTPTAGCAAPGEDSDSIQATGPLGSSPVVRAFGPFDVDRIERSVAVAGHGAPVQDGDLVEVVITIVNASSGDRGVDAAPSRVLLDPATPLAGLYATIDCSTPGSRIVSIVPSELAYGSVGQPDLGIAPDDDVIYVVDVVGLVPLQAVGDPVDLPADFPALDLEFAADGAPTIGIPAGDPPATLQSAPIIRGAGDPVAAGDEFLIQFQAVNWRTGDIVDQTWGDAPRSLLHLVPGVDSALVGQTVGSRVVVICPPGDAYGSAGDAASGVLGTDTVVYVVDILATTPPPA